ncbi:MAG: hypothetical protein JO032_13270 [Alphaproteobacteria bacterium]|nr:hypothetical protein [Alphaproteobacteria bacterium]
MVRGGGGGGHGAVAGGGGGAAAVHAGGGRFGGGHWGGDRWGGDFRGTVADDHAWHHRGWRGFGAGVWGGPYFDDWYDDAADVPSPYYGAPAYPAAPPPQIAGYWYYCASPQGYYPYVQQCSVAWQPVPPQG